MSSSPFNYGNISTFQNASAKRINNRSTNTNHNNLNTQHDTNYISRSGNFAADDVNSPSYNDANSDRYSKLTPQIITFPKNYLTYQHLKQSTLPQDSSSVNPNNIGTHHQTNYARDLTANNNYLTLLPVTTSNGAGGPSCQFPLGFNPRNSPNMPHREKVNRWINEVPVHFLTCRDGVEIWHSDCYPAVIPITSCSTTSGFMLDSPNYDSRSEEIMSNELFIDDEDVLEFQSRKITEYVRRLYHMDQSDMMLRGGSTISNYDYDSSSEQQQYQDQAARGCLDSSFHAEGGALLHGDLNLGFFESSQFQAALADAVDTAAKPKNKKRAHRPGNL